MHDIAIHSSSKYKVRVIPHFQILIRQVFSIGVQKVVTLSIYQVGYTISFLKQEHKSKNMATNCLAISKLLVKNQSQIKKQIKFNICLHKEMLSISDYKQCRPLAALKPKATASPKHCGAPHTARTWDYLHFCISNARTYILS